MVLAQAEIRAEVAGGRVLFDPPLEESQWGPASVDLRLGFSFTKLRRLPGFKLSVARGIQRIASTGFWDTMELAEEDQFGNRPAIPLAPGEFILGFTHETICVPRNLIGLVEGRSTYARLGISMHQTAPWIQPGWKGPIVLEIMNNGPLTVELTPLDDKPCQLTFFQLTSELPPRISYGTQQGGGFQNQRHPIRPS
jgi:dCTP deaminase